MSPVHAGSSVVFVPLAQMQVQFFIRVAEHLRSAGISAAFISLYEPGVSDIRAAGFEVVNFYDLVRAVPGPPAEPLAVAAQYGIHNVNRAISHEKRAYEANHSRRLTEKLSRYLVAMEGALTDLRQRMGRFEIVQELGGFIGVTASLQAAARLGIDCTFVEPSFFRGRLFLTRNSLAAPRIRSGLGAASPEVLAYLEETVRQRRIVIPTKDAGFYRTPIRKIVSAYHVRRLVEKASQKYLAGTREEFSHIGAHVMRHVRMVLNTMRLRPWYREMPAGPFIYYPLHVPADVALTLRSPEYLDQLALVDYLARNIPASHTLVIKEHPAMMGASDPHRVKTLLRENDNVRLLDPATNNLRIIERSALVVTVNSKSGAEAILLGRPVVVLGDAFYREGPGVKAIDALANLPEVLDPPNRPEAATPVEAQAFFQAVWDASHPGELYSKVNESVGIFAASLALHLRTGARP